MTRCLFPLINPEIFTSWIKMKTYKKTNKDKLSKISSDTKKIYKKFSIDDRIERMQECESYITQFERNYSHFLLMAAQN